jgi:dTDP-4-dehydrorhamnose reductase
VYPGSKGNYSEKSNLKPINNYAWSKLGGECAVQMYKKSLILRICMTEKPFIHKEAFTNMKTNFIFHDEVAKLLPFFYRHTGIINIGGKTQSVYNFAKKYNSNIKGVILKKVKKNNLNFNVSMNINKMKKIVNA